MKDLFPMDRFVDRDAEINELHDRLSFSRDDEMEPRKKIIHVVGKSGVGKTSLIKKFYNQLLSQEDFLPIYIDLTKYSKLNDDVFIKDLLKFVGGEIADELGIIFPFQDVDQLRELSNWTESVWKIQKQKILVLFFDEVSLMSRSQVSILEDYLLSRILLIPRIFLVFVGRYTVKGFKDFYLRPSDDDIKEVAGFDYQNTLKQINAFNMPQIEVFAPAMYEITNGSPGSNRKIIEKIAIASPSFDKLVAIRACNEELYAELQDAGRKLPPTLAAELLPALEALCVLQDFDKEYEAPILLAAHTGLSGSWDLKRSGVLLNVLCNIYIGPGLLVGWDTNKGAYALEEQVRFNLEQELKIRDKNLWKKLHCTAMKMYADWAREYNSDIFETKSEYHRTVLSDAGFGPETCQEG